tara:strand:+ start:282 stop:1019 length:738 start_codon:yes stop_codon:yes gene_type:complete
MLRNIYFEGELGQKFVPHLEIDCETPAEVFRCMDSNFPEFMPYLMEKHEEDVGFHVEVCGEELEYPEECLMIIGAGDMIITPVPAGSGKGFGKILAAVAIIAITIGTAGFTAPFTTAAFGSVAAGGAVGGILGGTLMAKIAVGLAINLALTGLAEMMAPDPSVDVDTDMEQSYLFNGSQQNIAAGDPVPVVYGHLRVPGQPASFEIAGAGTFSNGGITGASGGTLGHSISSIYQNKAIQFKLAQT